MQRIRVLPILIIMTGLLATASAWTQSKADKPQANDDAKVMRPLVTFVELGSVRCIPCKLMQPVMKDIEKDYAGQVKVVFHDVWTSEGEPFANSFKIRVIPTQIFYSPEGRELFRHEGFFAGEDILAKWKELGHELK